jgi:hypothetical protein
MMVLRLKQFVPRPAFEVYDYEMKHESESGKHVFNTIYLICCRIDGFYSLF